MTPGKTRDFREQKVNLRRARLKYQIRYYIYKGRAGCYENVTIKGIITGLKIKNCLKCLPKLMLNKPPTSRNKRQRQKYEYKNVFLKGET